jgi:Putative adhesin/Domain of unknown function (DUF5668)
MASAAGKPIMPTGTPQRSSIFTGLLLIVLGTLFLIHRFHPYLGVGHLVARYWPVLLIVWGVAKLVDYQAADRTGQGRPAILSPLEGVLLVLVVLVLMGMSAKEWIQRHDPDASVDINLFSEKATDSEELPAMVVPAGARVTITNGRGNITAHAGEGNELRVGVNETASAASEDAARDRLKSFNVVIEKKNGGYFVHPRDDDSNVSADLDVELPKNVNLTATSRHGDLSISGVSGSVVASLKEGDADIHGVTSDVALDVKHGDVRVSDIKGKLHITGKGNEVEINDITGDASIEGEFFGPIQVRNVSGSTHFTSQKSDITLAALDGRLELDSGKIEISDVSGAANITAREKDIEIENVSGRLDIQDTKGNIQVSYLQPPKDDVNISNDTGEVDLTLPPRSAFSISATTRSGEVHNDFEDNGVRSSDDGGTGRLNGVVGSGRPKITVVTSYGAISLHKSD